MREFLKPDWTPRGIRLGEITMNPPSLPADQAESIRELQRTAVLRSADMAAATLTGAQAEAMKAAAGNAGGAAIGFMGMNMAQMSGGMNAQQRSNGILYRHDARIDDEQRHGKTAITVDVKLEEMRNDACSEYYACGDAVGKRVLRCRMER